MSARPGLWGPLLPPKSFHSMRGSVENEARTRAKSRTDGRTHERTDGHPNSTFHKRPTFVPESSAVWSSVSCSFFPSQKTPKNRPFLMLSGSPETRVSMQQLCRRISGSLFWRPKSRHSMRRTVGHWDRKRSRGANILTRGIARKMSCYSIQYRKRAIKSLIGFD